MKIINGNIWDKWEEGYYIGVPVSCDLTSNGDAIMGLGIAEEAKKRIPTLPYDLGHYKEDLSTVTLWNEHKIITIPIKYKAKEASNSTLLLTSSHDLRGLMPIIQNDLKYFLEHQGLVYLPELGCGYVYNTEKRSWEDVKPIMNKYLVDDRFIMVKDNAS